MTPYIVTLTGPSCAGKTTLEKRLKQSGFVQVISHTTRSPRAGEENGKAYYFVDKSEFQRLRDTGYFVEVVQFNGNFYGVSAPEIERVASFGLPIVVIVEPNGLLQVRDYCGKHGWKVYSVYVDNPPEVIAARFVDRMLTDFVFALGKSGKADDVVKSYSQRLGVILGEEKDWASICREHCDLILTSFDERNIDSVVDYLSHKAQTGLKTAA